MIVDRGSLAVRPLADRLLVDGGGAVVNSLPRGPVTWSNELVAHVLEFKVSAPVASLDGVAGAIHASAREANRLLEGHGARLLGGGMHPWFDPARETVLWAHDDHEIYAAFHRLFDCRGHGWSNLQSFHLNLPFAGDAAFRRLHSAIRLALPLVPVLAAASPFADGDATGLLDTRLETYRHNCARVPVLTGGVIPGVYRSESEYRSRVLGPIARALAPLDPAGVLEAEWANARGAIARFDRGTIEIRLGDAQECPRMDLAVIAGLVALVAGWIAEADAPLAGQEAVATAALRRLLAATTRRARHAPVADPALLAACGEAAPLAAGELVRRRLARLGALTADLALVLDRGCLAERLVAAAGPAPPRPALHAVYRDLAGCLDANEPFLPPQTNPSPGRGFPPHSAPPWRPWC